MQVTLYIHLAIFYINVSIVIDTFTISNSIFKFTLIPRPICLSLMPFTIFDIMFPLTIISCIQLKIILLSFSLLFSINPLTFIIVSTNIMFRTISMRYTIKFFPNIYISLLYNLFRLFRCYGLSILNFVIRLIISFRGKFFLLRFYVLNWDFF